MSLKCFHSLALDLAAGRETVPEWVDTTPLMDAAIARVGRPPRVGDCYSKPEEGHPTRPEHSDDVLALLSACKQGGEALKKPLPKARVDRRPSSHQVLKRPAQAAPEATPTKRAVLKRPAAQVGSTALDALGGRDPSVPEDVHDRMLLLFAEGALPKSTPTQRQRSMGTSGSTYGFPQQFAEACSYGYLGPNLGPPAGMQWKCQAGTWYLSPRGG